MLPEAVRVFALVKQAHEESYTLCRQLTGLIKSSRDAGEIADAAYAARQAVKFTESMRGELRRLEDLSEKMACALWLNDPVKFGSGEPIRTAHCTATPDVKQMTSLPTRRNRPEQFAELMTHLGVPRGLWDVEDDCHAAVNFHWPGMVDYISGLAAQGKPLPPGVDPEKTYPIYKLRLHPRKEVDAPE